MYNKINKRHEGEVYMEDNVIELKTKTAYEDVLFFLEGLEAEATVQRYRKAIERFIKKLYDIPLQHVNESHFNNLTYSETKRYRDYLRKKYAASTVNNEMTAIFNLLKELNKIQRDDGSYPYSLNVDQLRTKSLRVKDVNSSGDISWEEASEFIDYLMNSGEVANGRVKGIYFHMARVTGFRKQALCELRFKDLRRSDNVWKLKSTLKGKSHQVSLKDEDADLLLELKETSDRNEKIFKISEKTIERTMDLIKKKFEIPEERRVTIHSFRGLSGWEAYLASGNSIVATKEHLNHSSMETTYGYISRRKSELEQPTLYMGKEFNIEEVKDISQEQWLEVYNELSRSAKYEIQSVIDKLGYSK